MLTKSLKFSLLNCANSFKLLNQEEFTKLLNIFSSILKVLQAENSRLLYQAFKNQNKLYFVPHLASKK